MESIVEQIIPGLGLGTATDYDIPTETVELEVVEMDLTTENDCRAEIADNGCAAVQSSSARESRNNCVLSQTVRGHLIVSDKCLYFTYTEGQLYQSEHSVLRSPVMSTMIRSWTKFTENTSAIIQTLLILGITATALMNYRLTSNVSFLYF